MVVAGSRAEQSSLLFSIYEEAKDSRGEIDPCGVAGVFVESENRELFKKVFQEPFKSDEEGLEALCVLQQRVKQYEIQQRNFDHVRLISKVEQALSETVFFREEERVRKPHHRADEEEVPCSPRSVPPSPPPAAVQEGISSLLQEFKKRKWSREIPTSIPQLGATIVSGCDSPDREGDLVRFLTLLARHNEQFSAQTDLNGKADVAGFVDRIRVGEGTRLCVRADIHADLAILLAFVEWLMGGDHPSMDGNGHCLPDVRVIFLGDYGDRGTNEIEVLTFLMMLHLENPDSVFFIRGNHEDISMALNYSVESEFWKTICGDITFFHESLPLALCVEVEGNPSQFVHFSHGLFPPSVDLSPLFKNRELRRLLIPKFPVMPKKLPPTLPFSHEEFWNWARKVSEGLLSSDGFMWNGPGRDLQTAVRGGSALTLSPSAIEWFSTAAGRGHGRILGFFVGHQHSAIEWAAADGKVICTVLPAGRLEGGTFGASSLAHPEQAIVLQAGKTSGEWTKRLVTAKMVDGFAVLTEQKKGYSLFGRVFSRSPSDASAPHR